MRRVLLTALLAGSLGAALGWLAREDRANRDQRAREPAPVDVGGDITVRRSDVPNAEVLVLRPYAVERPGARSRPLRPHPGPGAQTWVVSQEGGPLVACELVSRR